MPPSSSKPRRAALAPVRSIAVVEELRPRVEPPFPLIEAKLAPPVVSGRPISRADLVERVQGEHASVVSVVAPPATARARCSRSGRASIAGPSPGSRSTSATTPSPSARYIAFAMDRTEPVDAPVTEALTGLAPPRVVVPLLAGALARRRTPFVLVVQELHLLAGAGAVSALTTLLDHVPRGSAIVLVGPGEVDRLAGAAARCRDGSPRSARTTCGCPRARRTYCSAAPASRSPSSSPRGSRARRRAGRPACSWPRSRSGAGR